MAAMKEGISRSPGRSHDAEMPATQLSFTRSAPPSLSTHPAYASSSEAPIADKDGVSCIFHTPAAGISTEAWDSMGAEAIECIHAAVVSGGVALIFASDIPISGGKMQEIINAAVKIKVKAESSSTTPLEIQGNGCVFWKWFKRRVNLEPRYPSLVENYLFQESMFLKLGLPLASVGLAVTSNYPVWNKLTPLLWKLAGGSLLSLAVGESLKLICPELAVINMLASKVLGLASIYTVLLYFLRDDPICSLLVYLSGVMLLFSLLFVVVKIFKEDVRKQPDPEKQE